MRAVDFVWKFGYGSNISPSNLQQKKNIQVIEQKAAEIEGWTLAFHNGASLAEPAYATAMPLDQYLETANLHMKSKGDDSIWLPADNGRLNIHGLASKLTKEDAEYLDRQEGGSSYYTKKIVQAKTYSGEQIDVEIYVSKLPVEGRAASRRYLNIMLNGAKEVGLKKEYISFLESIPSCRPSAAQLEKRKALARPDTLKQMDIETLSTFNGKNGALSYKCALGYIIQTENGFGSWNGRDVTGRNLLHFRGRSVEKEDDMGRSPFPVLNSLTEEELDYLWQNLDSLLAKDDAVLIGSLKEFWQENSDYHWKEIPFES